MNDYPKHAEVRALAAATGLSVDAAKRRLWPETPPAIELAAQVDVLQSDVATEADRADTAEEMLREAEAALEVARRQRTELAIAVLLFHGVGVLDEAETGDVVACKKECECEKACKLANRAKAAAVERFDDEYTVLLAEVQK